MARHVGRPRARVVPTFATAIVDVGLIEASATDVGVAITGLAVPLTDVPLDARVVTLFAPCVAETVRRGGLEALSVCLIMGTESQFSQFAHNIIIMYCLTVTMHIVTTMCGGLNTSAECHSKCQRSARSGPSWTRSSS